VIGSLRIRGPAMAGLVLAAGLALTGCGPAKAGAAVIIDQQRVPISEIQNKVAAVSTARAQLGLEPKPADELAREQIQRLISHEVVARAGAQRGITVTDGQIDKTIADLQTRFGGAQGFQEQVVAQNIAPGDLRTFVQDFLISDALTRSVSGGATSDADTAAAQQEINALLSEVAQGLGVSVNPRYGVWDPETGQVSATGNEVSVPGSAPAVPPGQ
jgi:SurA-like N-terminal domain